MEDEPEGTVDVLRYDEDETTYRTVPAGDGIKVVAYHRAEHSRGRGRRTVAVLVAAVVVAVAVGYYSHPAYGAIAGGVVAVLGAAQERLREVHAPELVDEAVQFEEAEERYGVELHVEDAFVDE